MFYTCYQQTLLLFLCVSLFSASRYKLDRPHQYTRHSWSQVSELKPAFLAHQQMYFPEFRETNAVLCN